MRAKLVSESLEFQNEALGTLGVIGVIMLSWLGFKKLLSFILNKGIRDIIGSSISGLQDVKIHHKEKFEEEVKILELNDRFRISIPDGLILSVAGVSRKITIREIMIYKGSKEITVVSEPGMTFKNIHLTDAEYENVVKLVQSES